jgi:hypothetical protein
MRHVHTPPLRFLRDPGRSLVHAGGVLLHGLAHLQPLAYVLAAAAFALVVARLVLLRLREQRLARRARLLELAVPPELEAEGALLLWSALHDLLRPRLARLLTGQPQLAWEIAADQGGSRFRLWIPASVPPGLVERALAAAWPGITTQTATEQEQAE